MPCSSLLEVVSRSPTAKTGPGEDPAAVPAKVKIRMVPGVGAVELKQKTFLVAKGHPFAFVMASLRKQLAGVLKPSDSLFLFLNNTFAPNPEQTVGDLWALFRCGDMLQVTYCPTLAYG